MVGLAGGGEGRGRTLGGVRAGRCWGGGGGGGSALGALGSYIVPWIACSGPSKFLGGVPHSKKAATSTCSVAAMPAAVGDMCSKRTVVRLMAWATVTPFYGVAAQAASLWVRTYRRPRARSVPASH